MAGLITPFNDPEVLCLSVPALRRYWAVLLQDCAEKCTQEHPLYSLFSSIFSTLSKTISVSDGQISPASSDDSVIFSYPQCRIVDKNSVGDPEYDSISVYPDFGLIHLTTEPSPNGTRKIKVEQARLLIEIKRSNYISTDLDCLQEGEFFFAIEDAIYQNLRQLLLQAYCTFNVYGQSEVFIMLASGVHFTLLKFKRPNSLKPPPQASTAPNKKRKLEAEETSSEKPGCRAANEISNFQLTVLIPLECVEVIYHGAPVFDSVEVEELRLSDAFRQALRERLNDVNFQPCSLFDLHAAQYASVDQSLDDAMNVISSWYNETREVGTPEYARRFLHPYVDSPTGGETPLSPEYKGRAPLEVGLRESLQRKSKDDTNLRRGCAGHKGSEEGVTSTAGDAGSSDQEGSGDSDEEDGGGVCEG